MKTSSFQVLYREPGEKSENIIKVHSEIKNDFKEVILVEFKLQKI